MLCYSLVGKISAQGLKMDCGVPIFQLSADTTLVSHEVNSLRGDVTMSLVRYEPWSLLNQLQGEMNRMFDTGARFGDEDRPLATSDWVPAVDIKEEDDRYVIHADVPGVEARDIEVNMEDGILSIRGERKFENEEEREGYKRIERVRGSFYRRFSLPDGADADAISAKCKDGVLEIVIPKQTRVLPKRIEVQS
jgi:HSP20 family protein